MRKILALVLCLLMALSLSSAVAETAAPEEMFDGVWVQFEDGFEFYIPANWVQFECTEEMLAGGIFFMAGTEDGSYLCTVSWRALEQEATIEQALEGLSTVYPDAAIYEVNGVNIITYVDAESNLLNCVALDAAEPGLYIFNFYPAEDEEFQLLASAITASIRNF